MSEILVLGAHPHLERSRVNRSLLKAAAALPPGRVQVHDLYARYPDFHIDVAAEQAALAAAKLVVWMFPMHWYSQPPLLKLWLDEVVSFGWGYGPGGDALRGKDLWLVVSTGGTDEAYTPGGHHRHFVDAFWPPHEQTAALCGMRFLPPLVLHGAHQVSETEMAGHREVFVERLSSYPAWPEISELPACPGCHVPADERPEESR
jgi:glutathione-regulated potassium-efflux system ancillary protein KefF